MNNLKNQDGVISVALLFLIIVLVMFLIFFSLDIFGVIEVPKEYSMRQFIDSAMVEAENEVVENTNTKPVIQKKVQKGVEGEYAAISPSNSNNNEVESRSKKYSNEVFVYNRFYYSQLESGSRKIYNKIINNLDSLKSGTYTLDFGKDFDELLNTDGGDIILNEYFQSALNAVLLDNPEIFYFDITKMYLQTKSTTYSFSGTTYEVSIGAQEGDNYLLEGFEEETIGGIEEEIHSIKEEIIQNIEDESDAAKIKYVHDYLVENLEYDSEFSSKNIYNMYGALINNEAVCEGYAKTFKSIMDDLKIPCVVVCGTAENSKGVVENHAWNYVLVDDYWYAIDVTWDDPIVIGKGELSKDSKYKYYMKGSDSLFKDHSEDGNVVEGASFYYPKLNKSDY